MRPVDGPLEGVFDPVAPVSMTRLSSVYATEQARYQTADRVWQLVNQRFYDPSFNSVNWRAVRAHALSRAAAADSDATFYQALKEMVNTLGDSHTQVLTPRETFDRRVYAALRIGVTLAFLDNQVVIESVQPNAPAEKSGVRVGDVVKALGSAHAPVLMDEAFIWAALRTPVQSNKDEAPTQNQAQRVLAAVDAVLQPLMVEHSRGLAQPIQMTLVRADQTRVEVNLMPDRVVEEPTVQMRWLDGRIAFIKFNRFAQETKAQLAHALDEAVSARAVIIDLRGNAGGLIDQYLWFVGQFFEISEPAMYELRRDPKAADAQRERALRAGPGHTAARGPLRQPIVVLVDGRTASAAELTAVSLRELRSAVLVGSPTCGCVVAVPHEHILPDGGGVRIAETGFRSVRGKRMEGEPTEPTVRVEQTLADLRQGRDEVLIRAQHVLQQQLSERTALGYIPY